MRGPAIWKAAPQQNRCKNIMKNSNTALSHQIRSPRAEQLKEIKTLIKLTIYVPIGLHPLRQAALQAGLRNCKMTVKNNISAHFVISSAVKFGRTHCTLLQKLIIAFVGKSRITVNIEWLLICCRFRSFDIVLTCCKKTMQNRHHGHALEEAIVRTSRQG